MAHHALIDLEQGVNSQRIIELYRSASAVDCEGDVSYSDHAASKNPDWERLAFGRVYPQISSEKENGAEPSAMQTECLFQARTESPRLRITLVFLQPIARIIGVMERVVEKLPENGGFQFQNVPRLEVAGKTFEAWMEAAERTVSVIVDDLHAPVRMSFVCPASESREAIRDENGGIAGLIFRRHELLEGRIEIKMSRLQGDLFRISVRGVNLSSVKRDEIESPETILLRTFASTHFKLEAEGGEFVSLLGTPAELQAFADDCNNIGCWPVTAGDRKTIIASPTIIGNCGVDDGTEVDEIPAVRVFRVSDALL